MTANAGPPGGGPHPAGPHLVAIDSPPASEVAALTPLLLELGDLKRVRSAGAPGSVAERLFAAAWGNLIAGREPGDLALATAAVALAAARLGDIDAAFLARVGHAPAEAVAVLARGLDDVAGPVEPGLRARLRAALDAPPRGGPVPPFVGALARQPRAGVTCPGRPRIVLEPPENHAEHCLMVAVYGVLLAPHYGADEGAVFLASLAHHLHNAAMPDSGFTGEVLLEPRLAEVVERSTALALEEVPEPLRARVVAARACLPDAETPEGRAFHAADSIDRVAQIAQHLRAASLTMRVVLEDMALVHEGTVKGFQDRVLADARLLDHLGAR